MAKRKSTKGETTIYRTVHSKQKTEQHEPHLKYGAHSRAPEG